MPKQQVHIQTGNKKARRMVRCLVKVKSTSSHTLWKWESKMDGHMHGQTQSNKFTHCLEMRKQDRWSEAWSESNQNFHVQAGNEKARQNGQRHGQSQINKLTYKLEMRKQDRIVRVMVRVNQQVHIQTGNEKARRMVRCTVKVKLTSSHTF